MLNFGPYLLKKQPLRTLHPIQKGFRLFQKKTSYQIQLNFHFWFLRTVSFLLVLGGGDADLYK
jgi:hypothetical protein